LNINRNTIQPAYAPATGVFPAAGVQAGMSREWLYTKFIEGIVLVDFIARQALGTLSSFVKQFSLQPSRVQ
jgi:hypothetical protein